jgi:hypothetical protein
MVLPSIWAMDIKTPVVEILVVDDGTSRGK